MARVLDQEQNSSGVPGTAEDGIDGSEGRSHLGRLSRKVEEDQGGSQKEKRDQNHPRWMGKERIRGGAGPRDGQSARYKRRASWRAEKIDSPRIPGVSTLFSLISHRVEDIPDQNDN
jgi:hypothetical protein